MKNLHLNSLFWRVLVCYLFFVPLSSAQPDLSPNNYAQCNSKQIHFAVDFSGARLDKCQKLSESEFLITLEPENEPINDSPWFAFKVRNNLEKNISVNIKINGGHHRYQPKMSLNGKRWVNYPFEMNKEIMALTIKPNKQGAWFSAQEIINNKDYITWGEHLANKSTFQHVLLGKSTQGRAIYALEHKPKQVTKKLLVIIGRQHPPELTGAMALLPFTEQLASDLPTAQSFLQQYHILIVPNLNPDGVYLGNWRHNANGIDLNRDWINFSQIETKLVHDYIQKLVASGLELQIALDFHSTQKDVFYTMPSDYGVKQPYLVENWLQKLQQEMNDFKVFIKPGDSPGRGIFKQYIADTYNVHGITYEMGDNTDRVVIKSVAQEAAKSLMETLLSSNDHNIK